MWLTTEIANVCVDEIFHQHWSSVMEGLALVDVHQSQVLRQEVLSWLVWKQKFTLHTYIPLTLHPRRGIVRAQMLVTS
jgi:hypothetical protein